MLCEEVHMEEESKVNEISCGSGVNENRGDDSLFSDLQFYRKIKSSFILRSYKHMVKLMEKRHQKS